jgi:TolB-like protein/Tfp pilus assembly protein PilF
LWAAAVALVVAVVGFGIWQFYLRRPAIEPASEEKMAFPLPEKPSIAVLPFDNMSGDPGQNYFSDGITEEIISSLSKTDKLFVIARNSTFTYKGKPVRVKQVAEELGVRYVLEGSVRKSEDRVRITAQLIDATRGHHLWSERYDRELKDIFAVQDEITMKIVNALQIKLTEGEQARIWIRQSENLDVYLKSMEAASLFREGTKESIIRMGQLGQEIVDMAPESPIGYKTLAWYNWYLAHAGKSPEESITKAYKLVQKALALDESDAIAHALLGQIYTKMRQYDQAIAAGEKSVELDPNGALAHVNFGGTLCYAGRIDEGIDRFKQAIRLNPYPEYLYFVNFGRCYRQKGQYELALTEYKKAFQLSPDNFFVNMSLAAIYALLDRQEEAGVAAQKVLEINPNFTVESASKTWPYKNPADIKLFADALLKAGLPYTPPLPLPDKPSIAVLAFDNLSGDPEQEYFSDGIAENIITALSKVGELFVIARNSSFTYKGKPVKVQQVSRELGVRYVLEGSVQKSGDRVRITAQLIDATNGQHLWAENYDRELKDIFDIQDEITMKIVNALRVELTEGERARIYTKQFKSLDVYLKQAQATSLWNKGTREALIRYGQLTQEIIEAEPESPVGYRARAYYHNALAARGLSPSENYKQALTLAQKALSMDASDGFSYIVLGLTYARGKEFEKALEFGKRSVELVPNNDFALSTYGSTLADAQRFDEAISYQKQAIRLNPFPPWYYYHHLVRCYIQTGQYEDALNESKKGLQRAPNAYTFHFYLAITYAQLDRIEEARKSAAKALEINPHISVSGIRKRWRYKTQNNLEVALAAMRKAGFPE